MKNGKKPIRNPYVVLREEFDDWAVLFNPDAGLGFGGFGLNPTGVSVWKLLDGEHTIDALLEELRDHAEGVPEDAREHIRVFVDALVVEGLAGFDRASSGLLNNRHEAALRLEKYSSSPPRHVSKVKPFNYEPPKLVNLGSGAVAQGSCNNGSHADCCGSGNGATAGNGCGTGTGGDSTWCTVCCNPTGCSGASPGDTNCCNSGVCPRGCVVGFTEISHYSGPVCYSGCEDGGSSCS